jgi:hypothetical protein
MVATSLAKAASQYFTWSSCYSCLCQQVLTCAVIFILFKMNDFHEQQIRVKLGNSFTETFEMLKTAFGNEWWKRFKGG